MDERKTIFGKFGDMLSKAWEGVGNILSKPFDAVATFSQTVGKGIGTIASAPARALGLDRVADGIQNLGNFAGKAVGLPFEGGAALTRGAGKVMGTIASAPFKGVDLAVRGVATGAKDVLKGTLNFGVDIAKATYNFAKHIPIVGTVIKGMESIMAKSRSNNEQRENTPEVKLSGLEKGASLLKEGDFPGVGQQGLDINDVQKAAEKAAERGIISKDLGDVIQRATEKAQSAMPVAGGPTLTPDLNLGK